MKIELLVPSDTDLLDTIFKQVHIPVGTSIDHNGISIEYNGSLKQKGLHGQEFSEIIEMTLSITGNITLSILSNYLYDLCKNKVKQIWINGKKVNPDKESIEEAVKE